MSDTQALPAIDLDHLPDLGELPVQPSLEELAALLEENDERP